MTIATAMPEGDFEALALGKLVKVLGAPTGQRVFDETLNQIGLPKIGTADNLYAFADALSKKGGFEGAVGGLLMVKAVMQGAAGSSASRS